MLLVLQVLRVLPAQLEQGQPVLMAPQVLRALPAQLARQDRAAQPVVVVLLVQVDHLVRQVQVLRGRAALVVQVV